MAKIYYNDNGTWKVVDIAGGGSGGGGGSIDPTSTVTAYGFHATGTEGQIYIYPDNIQYWDTAGNQHFYFFPTKSGVYSYTLLTDKNVKTLFGNQSIVGSGNIDLYRHNICFTSTGSDLIVKIRFIVISSKNVNVNSLANLKTLLGNTFTHPVNGADSTHNQSIYEITETGFKSGANPYVLYDTVTPYPAGTWTDTVTTI